MDVTNDVKGLGGGCNRQQVREWGSYRIIDFEALGPVDKNARFNRCLQHRKREGKSELSDMTRVSFKSLTLPCHKTCQFLRNKIKKFLCTKRS